MRKGRGVSPLMLVPLAAIALAFASCELFLPLQLVGTWERVYSPDGVDMLLTYDFDADKSFEYRIEVDGDSEPTTLYGTYSCLFDMLTIIPAEEFGINSVEWEYSIEDGELTLVREDDQGDLIVQVFTKVD